MVGRWFAVLAFLLAARVAVAQEIREGKIRKTVELGHKPGSYLPMTSAPQVSGIFKYDKEKERFVVDERVNDPSFKLEELPSVVKLDLARARSAAGPTPRTYANLREEIEAALDLTLYELYNRWVPADRREVWKSVNGVDDFNWWGNCNGAAGAAIMEKLPERDFEVNGIKFTPSDFQHYYTIAYNGPVSEEGIGQRTDVKSEYVKQMEELLARPDSPTYLDDLRKLHKEAYYEEAPSDWEAMHFETAFKREIEAYKDISAPDFDSWIDRTIGEGKAVVFDRRPARVVWNYVASGYEREVKKAGSKEVNGETVDVYSVTTRISYGDYHDYMWDGSDGVYTYELYVKDGRIVGGTWTGASVDDHPDFAWRPKERIADSGLLDGLERRQRTSVGFLKWWVGMMLQEGGYDDLIDRLELQDYLYVRAELKKRGADPTLSTTVKQLRLAQAEAHYLRIYQEALVIQGKIAPTRGVTETLEGALDDGGR